MYESCLDKDPVAGDTEVLPVYEPGKGNPRNYYECRAELELCVNQYNRFLEACLAQAGTNLIQRQECYETYQPEFTRCVNQYVDCIGKFPPPEPMTP